jgi:hypothetical protein
MILSDPLVHAAVELSIVDVIFKSVWGVFVAWTAFDDSSGVVFVVAPAALDQGANLERELDISSSDGLTLWCLFYFGGFLGDFACRDAFAFSSSL